jgi:hypothetical protein
LINDYEQYYESGFYQFLTSVDNLMTLNKDVRQIQILDINGKILFEYDRIN